MINAEWFHNKNPKASLEYCELAATLYEVLWRQDAFESGVQIENYYSSFNFLFPNGRITVASVTPFSGATPVPCYFTHKNGVLPGLIHFTIGQLCSWLQNNWDYLIDGDKDD